MTRGPWRTLEYTSGDMTFAFCLGLIFGLPVWLAVLKIIEFAWELVA